MTLTDTLYDWRYFLEYLIDWGEEMRKKKESTPRDS